MIYDVLEQKIVDAGLAVPGVSLFRGRMPAECQVGVMFRTPLAGVQTDGEIPGWYKPNLQVIVRHTDPVEGQKLCDDVIKALIVEAPEHHVGPESGDVIISIFYPKHLPIDFPPLEGNGIEWSIVFTTAFAFKPSWLPANA